MLCPEIGHKLMPISPSDIVVLRKRIEIERKQLEEQERALKVVEEMLRGQKGHNGHQPELNLPHAPLVRTGFAQGVRDVVKQFGESEFTVAGIEDLLKTKGVQLPKKNSRPRIAMVLQAMVKKKQIKVSFEGTGSTPHRFKRI